MNIFQCIQNVNCNVLKLVFKMKQGQKTALKRLIIPDELKPDHKITCKKYIQSPIIKTAKNSANFSNQKSKKENCTENSTNNEQKEKKENEPCDKKSENEIQNTENSEEQINDPEKQTDPENQTDLENTNDLSIDNSEKKKANQNTILDDEELISLREDTKNSHNFDNIEPEKLTYLNTHIKEYVKYLSANGKYDEIVIYRSQLEALIAYQFHQKNDFTRSDEEVKKYEEELSQKKQEWQKQLEDFDAESDQKAEELATRHQKELDELNDLWNEDETLRKYRKPSKLLLDLWKQEKFLAKQGNIEEAKSVHIQSENLQKNEMTAAQNHLNEDFKIAKLKLEEKQEKELSALQIDRQHWREILISQQNSEKAVLENKKKVVDIRQKEPPKQREIQLASTTKTRGRVERKSYAMPEISFKYHTVLPPLKPPVQGRSKSALGSQRGTSRSQSENNHKSEETLSREK